MKEIFASILGLRGPMISEGQAISIAKAICEDNGWTWLEPIEVRSTLRAWIIQTNKGWRGACVFIKINKTTGDIIHSEYYPR